MRKRIYFTYPACLLAMAVGVGCGSRFGADVSGVVTNKGQALDGGTVAFHPLSSGTTAYGAIENDGSYTIKTGRERGLAPGEYIVTVIAREENTQRPEGGGPPPPGRLLSPKKYSQKETSDLKYTVNEGQNEILIDLGGG